MLLLNGYVNYLEISVENVRKVFFIQDNKMCQAPLDGINVIILAERKIFYVMMIFIKLCIALSFLRV